MEGILDRIKNMKCSMYVPEAWAVYPNTVFAFPFVKIVTPGGSCARSWSGRLYVCTCFRFSARKNRNTGAAVPAAG